MTLPAYSEAGRGEVAVLLLHGIGGGRAIWQGPGGDGGTWRALAAAGFRAVAIDLPGYGESAALGPPDLDSLVAGVRAVMAELAAARTVLVGHSMGGMVAQELVARDPRGVDALVLACTSAAFGAPGGDWQARFVAERLAPLDAGQGMAGMAAALVPGMVSPGAAPGSAEFAAGVMARVPEATYRSALRAIVAFDRREALARIAMPTLLLAGEHDRTAPAAVMQRMAQRIPGAAFVTLADAGHIANVEQPAAFDAALLDFLHRTFPNRS
jgi:pimeloyl-ACP methyl ester carboxylesterase